MTQSSRNDPSALVCLTQAFKAAEAQVRYHLKTLDPWHPEYGGNALAAFDSTAAPVAFAVQKALGDLHFVEALQQSWAVAIQSAVWTGVLFRAASPAFWPWNLDAERAAQLEQERSRLVRVTQKRWEELGSRPPANDALLAQMLFCTDPQRMPVPDFGNHTRLTAGARLRFRLAAMCQEAATLPKLLHAAAHQPRATSAQRARELKHAVLSAQRAGRRWRRLREVDVAFLDDKEEERLIGLRSLWHEVLVSSLSAAGYERIRSLRTERQRVQDVLSSVMFAVRRRDFAGPDGVDALLSQLAPEGAGSLKGMVPDAVMTAQLTRLAGEPWGLDTDMKHPAVLPTAGAWQPMSQESFDFLQQWAGRPLPAWWKQSAEQIAEWLIAGTVKATLRGDGLPYQDLCLVRRAWPLALQTRIIAAGNGQLLQHDSPAWDALALGDFPQAIANFGIAGRARLARRLLQLPDARPWLKCMAQAEQHQAGGALALQEMARMAIDETARTVWHGRSDARWGAWVASCVGTPEWNAVSHAALAGMHLVHQLIVMRHQGVKPVDPAGLRMAVVQSLHAPNQLQGRYVERLQAWMQIDPQAIPLVAKGAPVEVLQALAAHKHTSIPVLDALMEHGPAEVQAKAWRRRVRQAGSGRDLIGFVQHAPHLAKPWPWSASWLGLSDEQAHVAWVMAARCNGWRLWEVCRHLHQTLGNAQGDKAWRLALKGAVKVLCESGRAHREAAMLELVGLLGAPKAPALMKVFALAQRGAPAGHKLDHAYVEHLRQKKSGGQRVISAPDPALKAVQRALLREVLSQIDLHPSAMGFVKGRSICRNAQAHVGQAVVVNADVAKCFPSVKWPLVLAALRKVFIARDDTLSPVAVSMLCDVCTAKGGLPIGAPTSPALLNLVLQHTDAILHAEAHARGVRYTRYADDLTFSSSANDKSAVQMLGVARRTLQQIGLVLDPKKTNIFRKGRRQMVTGLVVNQQVSVPRHIRRRIRAAVHRAAMGEPAHWEGRHQSDQSLKGRIAFVSMVNPAEGALLSAKLKAKGTNP